MSPADMRGDMPEDMLSAYLDGELSASDIARVEAVVADDPQWAETLAEVSAARSVLRELPLHEAPPGVWDAIVETVSGTDAASAPVSLFRSRTARWIAAGTAAAAALALFVVPGSDTPDRTNPQLEELADSAAARQSLSSDPVSELVPVGVRAGLGP